MITQIPQIQPVTKLFLFKLLKQCNVSIINEAYKHRLVCTTEYKISMRDYITKILINKIGVDILISKRNKGI